MCHLNLRKFARETREMTRKMNIYFVITPMTHSVKQRYRENQRKNPQRSGRGFSGQALSSRAL